jgi:hypothetical protein
MSVQVDRSLAQGPPRMRRARRPWRPFPGLRLLGGLRWAAPRESNAQSWFERLPDPARHPECWFRVI